MKLHELLALPPAVQGLLCGACMVPCMRAFSNNLPFGSAVHALLTASNLIEKVITCEEMLAALTNWAKYLCVQRAAG